LRDGSSISVTELLEQFLFPRSTHGTLVSKLSGGEKRRLYLLKILLTQPNVLLFDEPTNDLDIDTLTVLEDYIQNFKGAVITVSHDRYFLDKTANKIMSFEGDGRVTLSFGDMSDYLVRKGEIASEPTSLPKAAKESTKVRENDVKKMSYMEKKEWATLEDEIAELEGKIEVLDAEINKCGSDLGKLNDLMAEKTPLEEELEHKYERWEYLSELA
jgi:ATP-binding cassette subfamily F protein uup